MSKESKKEETVREIISVKNLYKLYRVGDSDRPGIGRR